MIPINTDADLYAVAARLSVRWITRSDLPNKGAAICDMAIRFSEIYLLWELKGFLKNVELRSAKLV